MKYKAIFFDRDGTLAFTDPEKLILRDKLISKWSGKPFSLSYDEFMEIYNKTKAKNFPFAKQKTSQEVRMFFKEWFKILFEHVGIHEKIDERAQLLTDNLWFEYRILFPETVEVLEYFKSRGYKMGVISDTNETLEQTLIDLGIAKYFTSFTSSSGAGASKPSPIIFNAALKSLGVTAEESLYVDDYDVESDGAREQGFTSFLINRSIKSKDKWTITNLKQLIDFVEMSE